MGERRKADRGWHPVLAGSRARVGAQDARYLGSRP